MNKRVHEIAKERGVPTKEVLEKLRAAGIAVKAASSSVDETVALRALGNGQRTGDGDKPAAPAPPPAAKAQAEGAPPESPVPTGDGERPASKAEHKRPTRDSLQGERAPG